MLTRAPIPGSRRGQREGDEGRKGSPWASLPRARHGRTRLNCPGQTHQTQEQAGAIPCCLLTGKPFLTFPSLLHTGTEKTECEN